MARPRPETFNKVKTVAENRRARYEYAIDEVFEAGLMLQGTEGKNAADKRATTKEREWKREQGRLLKDHG